MVVLERLGETFLVNGRGSEVTSGGQKKKLGLEATINSKMALPLRVLSPFTSFRAPVDGAQLAHSCCPGPEAHTLLCTFVFRPLCGASGPRTRTRRLRWRGCSPRRSYWPRSLRRQQSGHTGSSPVVEGGAQASGIETRIRPGGQHPPGVCRTLRPLTPHSADGLPLEHCTNLDRCQTPNPRSLP